MYNDYFGLTENPFSITPDPRYLFMSEQHREALAHLMFGLNEGNGFVQLTGEVGTGKTTLSRCMLEQLPNNIEIALILNPRLSPLELLGSVCDELKIEYDKPAQSIKLLVDALNEYLLATHSNGQRTVLVIDESQNLSVDVLEQIRLLTNLETNTQKLLQIILIGQPELNTLLAKDELRQLSARITARYHLIPLSLAETEAYVRHRLSVSGTHEALFKRSGIKRLYALTKGIPRHINILADRSLLGAFVLGKRSVDSGIVGRAAKEVTGNAPFRLDGRWVGAGIAAVALFVTALLLYRPDISQLPAAPNIASASSTQISDAPAVSPIVIDAQGFTVAPEVITPVVPAAVSPPEMISAVLPINVIPAATVTTSRLQQTVFNTPNADLLAVNRLFANWSIEYTPAMGPVCDVAESRGLRCLEGSGSWSKLRQLNRPVMLYLVSPEGERRYAHLGRLDRGIAYIGGQNTVHEFSMSNIDEMWFGDFLLLWKRPFETTRIIGSGARGQDVLWVHQRLIGALKLPSSTPASTYFDSNLQSLVRQFQAQNQLVVDGIVGVETLIHLNSEKIDPAIPKLATRPLEQQ